MYVMNMDTRKDGLSIECTVSTPLYYFSTYSIVNLPGYGKYPYRITRTASSGPISICAYWIARLSWHLLASACIGYSAFYKAFLYAP